MHSSSFWSWVRARVAVTDVRCRFCGHGEGTPRGALLQQCGGGATRIPNNSKEVFGKFSPPAWTASK